MLLCSQFEYSRREEKAEQSLLSVCQASAALGDESPHELTAQISKNMTGCADFQFGEGGRWSWSSVCCLGRSRRLPSLSLFLGTLRALWVLRKLFSTARKQHCQRVENPLSR